MTPKKLPVVALVALALAACAKKRGDVPEEAKTVTSASPDSSSGVPRGGPKKGKLPDKMCRFESATATSEMQVVGISSLDLPMARVEESITCSAGPRRSKGRSR